MRLSPRRDRTKTAKIPEPTSAGIAGVLGGTQIATAYKLGYVLNFYREPSFRAIELEFGITRPEIVTLIFLHYREGVTASDICEFSGHLKANISRGIIALEKNGLLKRIPDAVDSRRQNLFLTEKGRGLYKRYIPSLKQRETAMLACLSPRERKQLNGLLDKLAAHVPDWAWLEIADRSKS